MARKTAVCFLLGLSPLALPLKRYSTGQWIIVFLFTLGFPLLPLPAQWEFHKEVDIVEVLLAPATIISVVGKKNKPSPNSQNKTEE